MTGAGPDAGLLMFAGAPYWTGAENPLGAVPRPLWGCCKTSGMPSRFISTPATVVMPMFTGAPCGTGVANPLRCKTKLRLLQDVCSVVTIHINICHGHRGCIELHWRYDVLCRLPCNDLFLVELTENGCSRSLRRSEPTTIGVEASEKSREHRAARAGAMCPITGPGAT